MPGLNTVPPCPRCGRLVELYRTGTRFVQATISCGCGVQLAGPVVELDESDNAEVWLWMAWRVLQKNLQSLDGGAA